MASDTIHLEGFAESLKSRRIYCVGSPNLLPSLVRSRIACVDTEVAHRGRKVLFIQEGSPHAAWLLRMKWDATFVIREPLDIRLGLTYVTNTVRPTRLLWAGGEPQTAVFAYLNKYDNITLIGVGFTPPQLLDWEAIFWTHDTALETIESTLNSRMGLQLAGKYNLRSVLKEIQASEVGLIWSSIGESDKKGSLYWFDPSEGSTGSALYSLREAADVLRSVADSIAGR